MVVFCIEIPVHNTSVVACDVYTPLTECLHLLGGGQRTTAHSLVRRNDELAQGCSVFRRLRVGKRLGRVHRRFRRHDLEKINIHLPDHGGHSDRRRNTVLGNMRVLHMEHGGMQLQLLFRNKCITGNH